MGKYMTKLGSKIKRGFDECWLLLFGLIDVLIWTLSLMTLTYKLIGKW